MYEISFFLRKIIQEVTCLCCICCSFGYNRNYNRRLLVQFNVIQLRGSHGNQNDSLLAAQGGLDLCQLLSDQSFLYYVYCGYRTTDHPGPASFSTANLASCLDDPNGPLVRKFL